MGSEVPASDVGRSELMETVAELRALGIKAAGVFVVIKG